MLTNLDASQLGNDRKAPITLTQAMAVMGGIVTVLALLGAYVEGRDIVKGLQADHAVITQQHKDMLELNRRLLQVAIRSCQNQSKNDWQLGRCDVLQNN